MYYLYALSQLSQSVQIYNFFSYKKPHALSISLLSIIEGMRPYILFTV